jgi:hypothetical protein
MKPSSPRLPGHGPALPTVADSPAPIQFALCELLALKLRQTQVEVLQDQMLKRFHGFCALSLADVRREESRNDVGPALMAVRDMHLRRYRQFQKRKEKKAGSLRVLLQTCYWTIALSVR